MSFEDASRLLACLRPVVHCRFGCACQRCQTVAGRDAPSAPLCRQIIRVLSESAIAVRTKAMKCLTMVVEADPAVLARTDMQIGVHNSFLDHSTSVREAAVDLVGKFILSRPELIEKYYDKLSARILVSERSRRWRLGGEDTQGRDVAVNISTYRI